MTHVNVGLLRAEYRVFEAMIRWQACSILARRSVDNYMTNFFEFLGVEDYLPEHFLSEPGFQPLGGRLLRQARCRGTINRPCNPGAYGNRQTTRMRPRTTNLVRSCRPRGCPRSHVRRSVPVRYSSSFAEEPLSGLWLLGYVRRKLRKVANHVDAASGLRRY
jgi:hypothetical protein